MNHIASFFVPGVPVGKMRARVAHHGKFVREYTPAKQTKYEAHVRECYKGEKHKTLPVSIIILSVLPIPKSFSKKKRADCLACETLPTSKPDTDNIAKSVMDALNGFAYKDDRQVTCVMSLKVYGENTGAYVVIDEADKENFKKAVDLIVTK